MKIQLDPQTQLVEEKLYSPQPDWNFFDVKRVDHSLFKGINLTDCSLTLVCGVSTAGKNTLLDWVLPSTPGWQYLPRATSRPPRPGEVDGQDYFFNLDETLIWSEYGGNIYAITRQVLRRLSQIKLGIMIQGLLYALVLKKLLQPLGVKVKIIYVLPGDLKSGQKFAWQIIQKRLEKIHPQVFRSRLASVKRELDFVFCHRLQLQELGVIFVENHPQPDSAANSIDPQAVKKLNSLLR